MRDTYRALWNSTQEGGMVGDGVKNLWWWQGEFVQFNQVRFQIAELVEIGTLQEEYIKQENMVKSYFLVKQITNNF